MKAMYKLVIVDDERRIRTGLKNIVNWEKLGFQVTELFSDGQEVIEYLDYVVPDVILTDIKMNRISGLDVAKFIFEKRLPCKVVLISGYQEFELARKGIQYGAEDFLLKPTEVEVIESTFLKIKRQLDEKRELMEKEQYEKERIAEAVSLLEERFFIDIVMGVVESEEYISNCMSTLYPRIDAKHCKCFLADIYIHDYEHFISQVWKYSHDQFETNLHNFLRVYQGQYGFHIVYKSDNLIEIFGICTDEKTGDKPENPEEDEKIKDVLSDLLREMEQIFGFNAEYKLRRICENIYKIGGKGGKELGEADYEVLIQYVNEQKKLVMSNISIGNVITAQKLFHNIMDEMKHLSIQKKKNVVVDIMSTLKTVLWELNEELARTMQRFFVFSDVMAMNSMDEISVWSDRIFDRIKNEEDMSGGSMVSRAKKYIKYNIFQDISQEEAANYLYICPSYLSRLFRKQTGESFQQFVTNVKMEKAKELLRNPQYKTYQVGEMLGYKTPKYFARLFRAHTGMNPSEYRSGVLHLGERFEDDGKKIDKLL